MLLFAQKRRKKVQIKRIPLDIETTELGAVELTDLAATVEKYMQGLDEIDTLKQALITALHFAAVAYLQRQNDGGKRKEEESRVDDLIVKLRSALNANHK